MEDTSLYSFIALLIPAFGARILLHKTITRLDAEKKQALLDSVSGLQKWRLLSLVGLVAIMTMLPQITFFALPGYLLTMSWVYWTRIKKTNPTEDYKRAFLTSVLLGLCGIGGFLYFQ